MKEQSSGIMRGTLKRRRLAKVQFAVRNLPCHFSQ